MTVSRFSNGLFFSIFPLLPQMSLGGFEITPPVTFRLQSGSGPVHISGQHFVRELLVEQSNNQPKKTIFGNACISSGFPPIPVIFTYRFVFLAFSPCLNCVLFFCRCEEFRGRRRREQHISGQTAISSDVWEEATTGSYFKILLCNFAAVMLSVIDAFLFQWPPCRKN